MHRVMSVQMRAFGRRYASNGIGFIGLGNMGGNMAKHLLQHEGRDLYVLDTNPKFVDKLVEDGAKAATSAQEVAANCTTIITMLPSGPVLNNVYNTLFKDIQKGSLLIDASTIGPVYAKSIHSRVLELDKDVSFCDAPVSGGVPGAAAGTLTFMVGANDETFVRAKTYLDKMGKNIVHCGPVVAGQTVKVANNLLLAASMIAVSEAMLIGTKLGCDPKTLAGVLNSSTGRCWSSDSYNPYPGALDATIPSNNNYQGGFAVDLMKKDLNLAVDAADSAGVAVAAGQGALDFYSKMSQAGMGEIDFSGALKVCYALARMQNPTPHDTFTVHQREAWKRVSLVWNGVQLLCIRPILLLATLPFLPATRLLSPLPKS